MYTDVCTVAAGVLEEDAVSIHAGKDFALMRTQSGKVTSLVTITSSCHCQLITCYLLN